MYKGVFLDVGSLDKEDLNLSALKSTLTQWDFYSTTGPEELSLRIKDADIIITNKIMLNDAVLQTAKHLKLVCASATGTNHVDLVAAKSLGIPVTNVTGYGTASVAQHTLMLMLALHTHFLTYQADITAGSWQKSPQFCLFNRPVQELNGKVLSIVGYGELGKAVAKLGRAFGMKILIAERQEKRPRVGRTAWEDSIKQADVLSLHCPLTDDTQHIINQTVLNEMKTSAFLINTARGGLIDEAALLCAIKEASIAGAAVDVLSEEPPAQGNILLEAALPNLIVTPHNAWTSIEARQKIVDELVLNIESFKKGEVRNGV